MGIIMSAINMSGRIRKIRKRFKEVFLSEKGTEHVQVATIVLIAVVIGLLLMEAFFQIFSDLVIPSVTSRLQEIFNYH
jgi:hypothetical protein